MQDTDAGGMSPELIQKAQAGDKHAFASMVQASQPRLEALAFLRLGRRLRRCVEVDDVIQETYLRAYRLLPGLKYEGPARLQRWLDTICEHVIQDLARHFQRQKRGGKHAAPRELLPATSGSQSGGLLELLPAPIATPSRLLQQAERFNQLEEALQQLSPEHRQVLLLARLHALPVKEIALRMNRSESAVGMLLLRAARSLRGAFGDTESWHLPAERLGELLARSPLDPPRDPRPGGDRA